MSLPPKLLAELREASYEAAPETRTAALKFLYQIDDLDLLNDQIVVSSDMDGLSFNWPNYLIELAMSLLPNGRMHFRVYHDFTEYAISVDAAIQLVIELLGGCVDKNDPYDEYKKERR